jgi:transposase
MAGVYQIEIVESAEDLKKLLGQQKTASGKERVQLLYLLKSQQAKTVQEAARMLGRHRVTVQEWLRKYREGGLKGLLEGRVSTGRSRAIPLWAAQALDKRLQESEGFNSYGEICQWLEERLGITANYQTVHQLVYYRLKGSPKVARTQSIKQSSEKLEAFKKTSLSI